MTWQNETLTPVGRLGIGLSPPRVHQLNPTTWWCRACAKKFVSRQAAAMHLTLTGCLDETGMRAAGLVLRGRSGVWGPSRKGKT